jgi:hypothetical protein
VTDLEYEAYDEQMVPRLTDVANKRGQSGLSSATWSSGIDWESCRSAKQRCRIGRYATSSRSLRRRKFCIDTIKDTVPI